MVTTPQAMNQQPSIVGDCEDDCMLSKLSPAALQLVAEFFKVLSESSRLQIVCRLRNGPKNVSEIIELTGL